MAAKVEGRVAVYSYVATVLAVPKRTDSGDEGYLVRHPGSMPEWMPKEDFEAFFTKVKDLD